MSKWMPLVLVMVATSVASPAFARSHKLKTGNTPPAHHEEKAEVAGQITAIDLGSGKLTVKGDEKDSHVYIFRIDHSTAITVNGAPAAISALKVGAKVSADYIVHHEGNSSSSPEKAQEYRASTITVTQ